ncbi:uncharacterized protein BDZ83DRAFT_752204 [Colletotrichum acutatum]|uniref:Uncharacterized protein n=1 Tax=Glomerella acutata TaxID=27357 RepID=A0AAD8UIC5_GLOAC|nr:uncharacterized protein BDZ83DRAFT_752204 [Colletotrichum acutatum]KAK1724817.1 hypothetical protein BDZ83DRAFT_752204 [Colletotrichum acutatum]
MLQNRCDCTRDKPDINRAISVGEDAVERIPKDWRYTALILRQLAVSRAQGVAVGSNTLTRIMGRRFEQTANIEDLDRAVGVLTDTVPLIPNNQMDYVVGTSYLATLLGIRSEQQGDVDDLNASISYTKSALQLMSNDDFDRPVQLYNLENRLAERAQYTGILSNLDDAVDYGQQALHLFLGIRFSMGSKNPEDIKQAIDLSRQAAKEVDGDEMGMRAALANVLSNMREENYNQYGEAANLDEAFDVLGDVLQGGLPDTLPERGYLKFGLEFSLGDVLHARSFHAGDATDLEKSRGAFQWAWNSRTAPLTIRIEAAVRAAEVAKERLDNHNSLDSGTLSMIFASTHGSSIILMSSPEPDDLI